MAHPPSQLLVPDVRARLQALGFDAPCTPESVGLVSSLLDTLILARDKSRKLAETVDSQAQALFTAEKTGPPLRREIARLLRENSALHSEVISVSERTQSTLKADDLAATSLRGKARDLNFLNSSLRARVQALETENAGLREAASRSFEVNGIVLPSGHEVRWHGRKERMEAHSPVTRAAAPGAAATASNGPSIAERQHHLVPAAEPARLVRAAEVQLSAMLHRVEAVEERSAELEAKLSESRAQVASREDAVARLAQQLAAALEAGPPAEARRVEQQSHAAAVGQLNSQVDFLNARCAQLEQALRAELDSSRDARLDADERHQLVCAIQE